jgi:isopenicillin N synthase-like dioxygenase
MDSGPRYAPPPGLPPGFPRLVHFPFLSPEQIPTLYTQGYARVHLPADHPLPVTATTLFATSRDFFARPLSHKEQFHLSKLQESKGQSSEEGWSRVEGEKEMLTIRRSTHLCPPEIADDSRNLWNACGTFMEKMMYAVEESMGLESGAFDSVVKEEYVLPVEDRHETLLRMFRYERAETPRLVAEQHRDLGLLSLVIGSSPGLDVWDDRTKKWVAIEEDDNDTEKNGGLTFTFLIGRTLARLTNNVYKTGSHRVFVPPINPSSSADDAKYRYSLVFALRPYKEAVISTASLTTEVTGDFEYPLDGVEAQTLFHAIANSHWSVNSNIAEREAQRLKLQRLKEAQMQAA